MERRNLQQGDVVDIYNHHGGVQRVAHKFIVVPYPIPPQCTATYFPETNVLVPVNSVAKKSNTPVSKAVVVRVKKVSG
jgi:anaerobic selenocysteine-containing dehydrogenase